MSEHDNMDNPGAPESGQPERGDWPSPGRKLQDIRESKGLTQAQVGESLHLTVHYINALENDEYSKLPGKTFAKGYLKCYAEYLGADVGEIVRRYDNLCAAEQSQETEQRRVTRRHDHDQNARWLLAAAVLVVAVLAAAWWFGRDGGNSVSVNRAGQRGATLPVPPPAEPATAEDLVARSTLPLEAFPSEEAPQDAAELPAPDTATAPPDETAAGEPAPELFEAPGGAAVAAQDTAEAEAAVDEEGAGQGRAEAVTAPAPDADIATLDVVEGSGEESSRIIRLNAQGDDLLEIHFSGTSWVEVDDGENTRLYNDNLHRGDELSIRGEAPFNVLVGDATRVDMEFNQESVDLMASMRSDNSARILLEP